jgi:chemotaxis signal transduction protein
LSTSLRAFVRIQPTARETRAKIMEFAAKRGARGFVVDELVEIWHCSANHVAPRCTELVKSGQLVATGRTRPTQAGHAARILVAARFAQPAQPELALTGEENARYPG